MYVPSHFALDDSEALGLLSSLDTGHLISVHGGVPHASLLPMHVRVSPDHPVRIIAHFARGNPHWRHITSGDTVLFVATGPDAYVSPGYYPSKAETGRVVPTWNYVEVQARGVIRLLDDEGELLAIVHELTDHFEAGRDEPWSVDDAPSEFIAAQLRAIVGVEITVTEITGKAKLSQNRPDADRIGARDGLRGAGGSGAAVAALMGGD
jgi:transcriptional regulator